MCHPERSAEGAQSKDRLDFGLDDQLEAACSIHGFKASRILAFFDRSKLNDVPDVGAFRPLFTFRANQLREYVVERNLADEIIDASLGQRALPSAYLEPQDDRYEVGWFDGHRSQRRYFADKALAVTDFVLLFWGLERLP